MPMILRVRDGACARAHAEQSEGANQAQEPNSRESASDPQNNDSSKARGRDCNRIRTSRGRLQPMPGSLISLELLASVRAAVRRC